MRHTYCGGAVRGSGGAREVLEVCAEEWRGALLFLVRGCVKFLSRRFRLALTSEPTEFSCGEKIFLLQIRTSNGKSAV